jgi:hypothetical protein
VRRLWVLRPTVTGWTWVVRPWLKLHPKTEPIQSNPHCSKARNVAGPGPQTIRLVFDKPQKLRRIWLKFEETEIKIVRQQWNFSPPETERETETTQLSSPMSQHLN